MQAVEAEVAEFLSQHAALKTGDGLLRVVRHARTRGHDRHRPSCRAPARVPDREGGAADPERIRFTQAILPPYARSWSRCADLCHDCGFTAPNRGAFTVRRWR
jgi:putative transposase